MKLFNIEYSTHDCILFCINETSQVCIQSNKTNDCKNPDNDFLRNTVKEKCLPNCPIKCQISEFKTEFSYDNLKIISMSPPSSGGILHEQTCND